MPARTGDGDAEPSGWATGHHRARHTLVQRAGSGPPRCRSAPELGAVLAEAAQQVAVGQRVSPEIVERLARPHGVGQLLVIDVFRHEQHWGRETRITRVGVEGRLVQLADGRTLWQGRYDPEISDAPGRGYDAATRRAARSWCGFFPTGGRG